jgi:hypothetical protein
MIEIESAFLWKGQRMEIQSDLLSATWLKPIVSLIRNRDFDEAYALAEYYPATTGRKLVQCAALDAQKRITEANTLL